MKHTPTPWVVSEFSKRIIDAPDGYRLAETDGPDSAENAAFIVRACNAHEQIVNHHALIDAEISKHMSEIEEGEWSYKDISAFLATIQNHSRAALAKAEGRS